MTPVARNRYLVVLVFCVGSASLGAEIAAARLLAPYFGASTIVWANTIGVVLVALSVGYWLGGRFADRKPELRALCLLVLSAAVLMAMIPFAARPFLSFSVDAFDQISVGGFLGSLFGVLVLVALPVMLLGAASPWALRLSIDDVKGAGEVAGRLYAISTAGSLFGTMIAALVLIPFAGTQRTFLVFAVLLALVAVVGLERRFLVAPAALAVVLTLPVGSIKSEAEGTVLFEEETANQYVRVIEQSDGDRILELNEGQATHSFLRPGSYLTGDYWDGFQVLPSATLPARPRRIAILGSAAGTIARSYGRFQPQAHVDAVEIDAELFDIGHRYFDLDNPNLDEFAEDARPWLERSDGRFDVIVVDAYRQPYVPFYLATREFFELARDRLAPGGAVIVNVGHPDGNDDLERVLGATMADVFPTVKRAPIEETNTLLLGTEGPATEERLRAGVAALDPALAKAGDVAAASLADRLPGGEVYTDDRAPVEWLIDASLLGYAENG